MPFPKKGEIWEAVGLRPQEEISRVPLYAQ